MHSQLFDPGLQPERTELAWRRTVLAVAIGAIAALRLLPPVLGTWSLSLGFAGLGLAGTLLRLSARRAKQTRRALLGSTDSLPGGALLLLLGLLCTTGALLSLLYVMMS